MSKLHSVKYFLFVCTLSVICLVHLIFCLTAHAEGTDGELTENSGGYSTGKIHINASGDNGGGPQIWVGNTTYFSDNHSLFVIDYSGDESHSTSGNQLNCYYICNGVTEQGYNVAADITVDYIFEGTLNNKPEWNYNGTKELFASANSLEQRIFSKGFVPGSHWTCTVTFEDIPVFAYDDHDAVVKYVETGDTSGALNDGELIKGDTSIELPRNFKVTGGYATGLTSAYSLDKDFVGEWSQTVDTADYRYEIEANLTIRTTEGEQFTCSWQSFSGRNYDGDNQIVHKISSDNLDKRLMDTVITEYVNTTGNKLKYKGWLISKMQVRVRNCVDNRCSDWVVITIDFDGTTTTATVEDDNGNTVDNDEYNGNDVADTSNSDNNGDITAQIATILSYIRSGFGLLGNNGIIALMSGLFSFIPASIWTLIKTGIAISITIMVIALLKNFVFG